MERRFTTLVKVAADSVEQLRKVDTFRVIDNAATAGIADAFAAWLVAKRPDLADEVADCLADVAG